MKFSEPPFHKPHYRTSETGEGKLSKQQLVDYFAEIDLRIKAYLKTITIESLREKNERMNLTYLDLILIQFRHVMHHIGYLHLQIKNITGTSPEYIGYKKNW